MAKRGDSGLSLVVGVDKPQGMTSHDVVSRCRRIFNEKRIGHTGTLDPLATGVLLICVGSAARLDKYLVGHDKTYVVEVAFGAQTDTDDCEGAVIKSAPVPDCIYDESFAQIFVQTLVGKTLQIPPQYSALKKNGVKACDAARAGQTVELEPRQVEIYRANLLGVRQPGQQCEYPLWQIELAVSKGTYIRSVARDLGLALNTVAHVHSLQRTESGAVALQCCTSLEALQEIDTQSALDPVSLLGYRYAHLSAADARRVDNGNALPAQGLQLFEPPELKLHDCPDCCIPMNAKSLREPHPQELICLVYENKLSAIYCFDAQRNSWKADCVFKPAISREGFSGDTFVF